MRVMRWVCSILVVAMIGFMSGCLSPGTNSDSLQGVDFKGYKTYAWLPFAADTSEETLVDSEITYRNIKQKADEEMARRGYVLDTRNPDLLLKVHTDFEKTIRPEESPLYSGYNYYYYPGTPSGLWNPYHYDYNTNFYTAPYSSADALDDLDDIDARIIIDVVDREKQKLVWRGWAEETLYDENDTEELYEDVENIFERYPVTEMNNKHKDKDKEDS